VTCTSERGITTPGASRSSSLTLSASTAEALAVLDRTTAVRGTALQTMT
jgi:hypothetical protein